MNANGKKKTNPVIQSQMFGPRGVWVSSFNCFSQRKGQKSSDCSSPLHVAEGGKFNKPELQLHLLMLMDILRLPWPPCLPLSPLTLPRLLVLLPVLSCYFPPQRPLTSSSKCKAFGMQLRVSILLLDVCLMNIWGMQEIFSLHLMHIYAGVTAQVFYTSQVCLLQ